MICGTAGLAATGSGLGAALATTGALPFSPASNCCSVTARDRVTLFLIDPDLDAPSYRRQGKQPSSSTSRPTSSAASSDEAVSAALKLNPPCTDTVAFESLRLCVDRNEEPRQRIRQTGSHDPQIVLENSERREPAAENTGDWVPPAGFDRWRPAGSSSFARRTSWSLMRAMLSVSLPGVTQISTSR